MLTAKNVQISAQLAYLQLITVCHVQVNKAILQLMIMINIKKLMVISLQIYQRQLNYQLAEDFCKIALLSLLIVHNVI